MYKRDKKKEGNALESIRKTIGYTRNEFAEKIGLENTNKLKDIELGRVNISGLHFKVLLHEFGITKDHIINGVKFVPQANKKFTATEILGNDTDNQQTIRSKESDEDWTVEEMLNMTRDVLESQTIYRPALAANVRAFHRAISNEDEMKKTTEEVRKLRKQNQAISDKMERVEEMLLSLGATPSQKRDTA